MLESSDLRSEFREEDIIMSYKRNNTVGMRSTDLFHRTNDYENEALLEC